MVSMQKAQTGARVYNGVSQSPNRGQVSAGGAQGYIRRELAKNARNGVVRPKGGDGQSDSRSAVAASALKRAKGKGNLGRPMQGRQAVGGGGAAGGAPAPAAAAMPQAAAPTISIKADGVLQLPYDQTAAEDEFQANSQANDNLIALQGEENEHNINYAIDKRNMDSAYDSLKRQTLNTSASNGVANSSVYSNAVSKNATNYSNNVGDLERVHTSFLNNLGQRRTAVQTNLAAQLGLIANRRSMAAAEQAAAFGAQQAAAAPAPAPAPAAAGPVFNPVSNWTQYAAAAKPKPKPKPKPKGKK